MINLSEVWDKFFQQHPTGGLGIIKISAERKKQDDHVVDFLEYYNFEKNLKVLDCGCWWRNSEYLINEGYDVTGVDFSKTVIERTQKRLPKGKFITGDIRKLDKIESNSFDILIDSGLFT